MSKHTPGPWIVNEDSCEIYGRNEKTVVQFSERFTKQERTDARLIATAPELLEYLDRARQIITNNGHLRSSQAVFISTLEALILKATGGGK